MALRLNHCRGRKAVRLNSGVRPQPAEMRMSAQEPRRLVDGVQCNVVRGTHAGKSGAVADINTSKTGHVTIPVVQKDGVRFKTLAKNVVALDGA